MVRVQLVSVVVLITFLAHGRLPQLKPAGICVRGQYRERRGLKIGNWDGNFQLNLWAIGLVQHSGMLPSAMRSA